MNILMIHSDQHRFDCLGINGHPLVQTPNLDALAGRGVNFTNAFCPIPLCTPTRGCLLTGVWPMTHQALANGGTEASRPMRDDLVTWSELLQQAGYALDYVGKWHVSSRKTKAQLGWDRFLCDSQYHRWRQDQNLPPQPDSNRWLGQTDLHITPEQSSLHWQADHVINMLRERARQGQPFMLRWDPPEPHLPNRVCEPYASLYEPSRIDPWPSWGDTFEGKPYIQAQQLRTWGLDQWTWNDWQPLVARYLGEITMMDEQIGRVLAELDHLGLADDTLVIYSSDHGDMCGAHGMLDKHFILYDDVVRVPLILRWPGTTPGVCQEMVCSALDLACTILDAAGVPRPASFAGTSLKPDPQGIVRTGRQDIFAVYFGNQFGLYSQRMVRNRRWKYVYNATAEDELYDLETDPAELTNLATSPQHVPTLHLLRRRLAEWMQATADPLLNEWTRTHLLENRKI